MCRHTALINRSMIGSSPEPTVAYLCDAHTRPLLKSRTSLNSLHDYTVVTPDDGAILIKMPPRRSTRVPATNGDDAGASSAVDVTPARRGRAGSRQTPVVEVASSEQSAVRASTRREHTSSTSPTPATARSASGERSKRNASTKRTKSTTLRAVHTADDASSKSESTSGAASVSLTTPATAAPSTSATVVAAAVKRKASPQPVTAIRSPSTKRAKATTATAASPLTLEGFVASLVAGTAGSMEHVVSTIRTRFSAPTDIRHLMDSGEVLTKVLWPGLSLDEPRNARTTELVVCIGQCINESARQRQSAAWGNP